MLDSLLPMEAYRREIDLRRAIELAYLGQSDRSLATLPSMVGKELLDLRDYPGTNDLADNPHFSAPWLLAEWLAVDAIGTDVARGEVFSTGDHSDLSQWAKVYFKSIHSRCRALSLDFSVIPLASARVADFAEAAGAQKRRTGKSEEARHIEYRLTAIAQELVRSYPNQSASYIGMSRAHIQSAKNAWNRSRDVEAVESLKKSRDAARRALSLDPARNDARRLVDDCERRLLRASAG